MAKPRTQLDNVFSLLAILTLIAATYLAFSSNPIASIINYWQTKLNGDNKYYPSLTVFLIAIPPLIVLLFVKSILKKKK